MAKIVEGIVTAKFEKNGRTKKGGYWKLVRLEIDGDDSYGAIINKDVKKFAGDVSEGDRVKLRIEKDGDFWNYTKGKIIEKQAAPVTPKKGSNNYDGAQREFAASVGKGTGIVQALIGAKKLKDDAEILEAIVFYSTAIHELVVTGPVTEEEVDEAEEEGDDLDAEEEMEDEAFDDDDADEDFDED